jgi:(S)-ureidoglycine aminohydrolase
MKKITVTIVLLIPVLVFAQQDSIASGMYSWKTPAGEVHKNILPATLFEGTAHDMEYLQMSANTLATFNNKIKLTVPENEEHLLIIKSGTITIAVKDSTWALGAGSIALLMPGEKYALLKKNEKDTCCYYLMKYRSKLPVDAARGQASGGSLVKDWTRIEFKPHDKGGIRNYFERPTAMCKRLEMHVSTLKEGIRSHDPHTHHAEEIILVINGKTEMQVGDKFYKGTAGTIYYLGSNVSHAIRNDGGGTCTYFAFQFE